MSKLRKFARLRVSEKLLLLRAFFVVASIRMGLWVLPFRVMRRLAFNGKRKKRSRYSVEQFVWAVTETSRYVPGAACLAEALAGQVLLSRAGYSPRVQIGVAMNEKNEFEAHAWLVLKDQVLIGDIGLERFTPLTSWEEGH
jgi:hypothetical protein